MEIYVATEQRFWQYESHIYAEAVAGYGFWRRYLDVFTTVHIVARVSNVHTLPKTAVRADGDGVKFAALPQYVGLVEGATKFRQLQHNITEIAIKNAAYLLRVPGGVGTLLYWQLRKRKWPFAIEVVGDPQDSLSPQALGSAWGHLVRPIAVCSLKQQSRQANCAAFVTRESLQCRYPPAGSFSTYYSSIELPQEHFDMAVTLRAETQVNKRDRPALIFVGSLSQRYKGLHVLLHAMRLCLDDGIALSLTVLGDGQYRQEYEQLAKTLGLETAVTFYGYVMQGESVIQKLCTADLFVMPSLVEGLPRALIEAMACGLPCIGSRIGGIPELLEESEMVPPGDVSALTGKITDLIQDPKSMELIGVRNIEVAKKYRIDVLRARRQEFYKHVYDATLDHMLAGAVEG